MISFSEDQILEIARRKLSEGDFDQSIGLLQRSASTESRQLMGEAVYERGKRRVSTGEYRAAKDDFAMAVQHNGSPVVRSLAQERVHLLNNILNASTIPVSDEANRLANVRVSPAIAMPPDAFAPMISFIACVAAYRSGYDPKKSDPLSRLIRLIKRGVEESTIERLGEILADYLYTETPILRDADFIVPIPADAGRATERGYSIPMTLAAKVAVSCAIPLHAETVETAGALPELRRIPRWARALAIEDAFRGTDKATRLKGMNILIVDDVVTSGATLNEMANVLLSHGAHSVYALALAHSERSN